MQLPGGLLKSAAATGTQTSPRFPVASGSTFLLPSAPFPPLLLQLSYSPGLYWHNLACLLNDLSRPRGHNRFPDGLSCWRVRYCHVADLFPSPRSLASLVFRSAHLWDSTWSSISLSLSYITVSSSRLSPALGSTFTHSKAWTLSPQSLPLGLQNIDEDCHVWGALLIFMLMTVLSLGLNYTTLLPSPQNAEVGRVSVSVK